MLFYLNGKCYLDDEICFGIVLGLITFWRQRERDHVVSVLTEIFLLSWLLSSFASVCGFHFEILCNVFMCSFTLFWCDRFPILYAWHSAAAAGYVHLTSGTRLLTAPFRSSALPAGVQLSEWNEIYPLGLRGSTTKKKKEKTRMGATDTLDSFLLVLEIVDGVVLHLKEILAAPQLQADETLFQSDVLDAALDVAALCLVAAALRLELAGNALEETRPLLLHVAPAFESFALALKSNHFAFNPPVQFAIIRQ